MSKPKPPQAPKPTKESLVIASAIKASGISQAAIAAELGVQAGVYFATNR